ncbi:MAG: hypothetical protein QOJ56_1038 [Mycobacterium sp.]|jgi:hypothetical protein|nr:hypothetical protein [Mycobacterium sp.]
MSSRPAKLTQATRDVLAQRGFELMSVSARYVKMLSHNHSGRSRSPSESSEFADAIPDRGRWLNEKG